ncbi:MAG: shikimate dehydrogenase [bacterium]|nr:shikimate dehydrogenase [bacterium]
MNALTVQDKPTIYFIGVTTQQSSIMKVFPKWSEILGLGAQIVGYDAPIHAPDEVYSAIVEHIRHDPLSRGALVTTHKIDLLRATRDLFDQLDPYAELCGEISCISKRGDTLWGHAKDPISSGLTWDAFVPAAHWDTHAGEVLCLGAGGAAIAISVYVAESARNGTHPYKFTAVDISQQRLDELRHIHRQLETPLTFDYLLTSTTSENDQLLNALPPGSMVINATGLGKDRPGSPISDSAVFPEHGLVWELNYRGALDFLHQARRQAEQRHLRVEDGWLYFVHGWTQVIAEVFHIDLTDERFRALDQAASAISGS